MNARVSGPRLRLVDALRGIAIVAMVAYHLAWDLWFLGFAQFDITAEPGWVLVQRAIVSSFLGLVGVGLVLAHGDGIRWRPFWRRFAVILGAAVLTSIGTYIAFPDYYVYFGVLHAIALFSLIGLGFVRLPFWVTALAGAAVIGLPLMVTPSVVMVQRELSWIGFWPFPPPTTDIVPVFPWLGAVLLGIALMRALRGTRLLARIAGLRLDGILGRALRWLGRWSLVIYLVHQPLLYGGLSLIAPPPVAEDVAFTQSCEAACTTPAGADAGYCARYCLCALEQVTTGNLWSAINATPRSEAQQSEVDAVTKLCSAMAE